MHKLLVPSPVGMLEIAGTEKGVVSVNFAKKGAPAKMSAMKMASGKAAAMSAQAASRASVPAPLRDCARQLEEYFAGRRKSFDCRLDLQGTDFQKKVWRALMKVPFGKTASYGKIARAVGRPGAARAVGGANHANPVAVIVPCHRIIGADGSLTGYGAGIERKAWLLEHEQRGA
ncbi:MAG: methylated-DNA--[protein]-cysteine S-methyltransferase [Acidobacteriota bacterium]|nr:methylated-DNA--[protein]-cysteine S-methyltransferase [Acidobacteriota bacterium]